MELDNSNKEIELFLAFSCFIVTIAHLVPFFGEYNFQCSSYLVELEPKYLTE